MQLCELTISKAQILEILKAMFLSNLIAKKFHIFRFLCLMQKFSFTLRVLKLFICAEVKLRVEDYVGLIR